MNSLSCYIINTILETVIKFTSDNTLTKSLFFCVCRSKGSHLGSGRPVRQDWQHHQSVVFDQPGTARPGHRVLVPRPLHRRLRLDARRRQNRDRLDGLADQPPTDHQRTHHRFRQLHVHPHNRGPG